MMHPNQPLAIQLAQRQLAELVCDAVNLENIPYTLPEVMTLLDGITVGGHPLADERITLNQADAWRFLFQAIQNKTFRLDSAFSCTLHAIAAKEEALKWGQFRDGLVRISGTTYRPPASDQLAHCFDELVREAFDFKDMYDRAIFVFLKMARTQFFYDVNKRMGRFMMNGILLEAGFPVINVPASRQLEFNTLMLEFYSSNNLADMNAFMRSCLDAELISCFSCHGAR